MGTRVSSPATIAGEDARAPMQTAVITVREAKSETMSTGKKFIINKEL